MSKPINFKPIGDKILVKHLPPEKIGLLFIPEKINDGRRCIRELPAILAEVIAVGSLKQTRITPGQRVQMNPYSGTELRLQGILYALYNESDLLAVVSTSA